MDLAKGHMKLLLAVVGGIAVVAAVTVTIVLVTGAEDKKQLGEPITFDEFLNARFRSKSFNGSWWTGTEIQWQDVEGNLVLWNLETSTTSILVSKETLAEFGSSRFLGFAPNDKDFQLFASNIENVWRHSFLATYSILDSRSGVAYPLELPGKPGSKLQFAEWLPHPISDMIVFVYENNIYVREVPTDPQSTKAITTDGVVDNVYNGIPDWVYEEEVLSSNKAMYYSRSGSRLAFAKFDDSQVQEFHYTKYGSPDAPFENQYPQNIMVKYPKVGTTNPTLLLQVKNLETAEPPKNVVPPSEVYDYGEHLYTAAQWSDEDTLNIIWMNRVQSKCSVSKCTEQGAVWQCLTQYSLSEEAGWLDLFQPPIYKSTGDAMLQIQSTLVGTLHYRQLAKITNDGSVIEFLTKEAFVVTEILGWDEINGIVYFMGTASDAPGKREFYSVSDQVGSALNCITCQLTMPTSGDKCGYNSVRLSPDFLHYVQVCAGPAIPEVVIRQTADHTVKFVLEDNKELQEKLVGKAIPDEEYSSIDAGNGQRYFVKMKLPPTFDAAKKYPALVNVYAGPDSQEVDYRWSIGWGDYLSTNYDVIYIFIDGRGSGFQNNEHLFAVNRKLGTAEIEDQITVMKDLQSRSYIDADRTGIWGWSYGGYSTAMALIKDDDGVFSCGISVAPPTNWLFYDSIYTERYMGLPTPGDNMEGYNDSSIISKVEKLRGKMFQLNHGVADDNVHYQQSMMLIKALELADIQFDQQSFPDENHGLSHVSKFLYHSFDLFWSKCFGYTVKPI